MPQNAADSTRRGSTVVAASCVMTSGVQHASTPSPSMASIDLLSVGDFVCLTKLRCEMRCCTRYLWPRLRDAAQIEGHRPLFWSGSAGRSGLDPDDSFTVLLLSHSTTAMP